MYLPDQHRAQPRRGVILLVVIILLTLFALVGLGFVYYASSQADAARVYREAQVRSAPGSVDQAPEDLLAQFLRQWIFDVDDSTGGAASALRGHSLARTMYGWNDDVANYGANSQAFNGVGRLHTTTSPVAGLSDEFYLINYTYFPTDGFVRDPERPGSRTDPTVVPRKPFIGGFNAPYTAADLNMMCLAAMKADGTVLLPSYHRPYLFGSNNKGLNPTWGPTNANWTNVLGKYLTLRPRNFDQAPNPATGLKEFPDPDTASAGGDQTGDVRNLSGATQVAYHDGTGLQQFNANGNDSYWIDIGSPIQTTPEGKKFKALFAPFILDLNSRINLNVHGNRRGFPTVGGPGIHVSNQGWGPWEVDVSRVLTAGANEWVNLLWGNAATSPSTPGRYGADQQPGTTGAVATPGYLPLFYGQVDFDGCNETVPTYSDTDRILLPVTIASGGGDGKTCFPTFQAGYGNRDTTERTNHPLSFNLWQPNAGGADDRVFDAFNMRAFLLDASTTSDLAASDLGRLCPTNFTDPAASPSIRRLVTTTSFDVDRPGITPWLYGGAPGTPFGVQGQPPTYTGAAGNNPIGYPALGVRGMTPDTPNGEFGKDWRSVSWGGPNGTLTQVLAKVDLNRFLPPYPHLGKGWSLNTDPTDPPNKFVDGTPVPGATIATAYDLTNGAIQQQFKHAQEARQKLARDIYDRLMAATGAPQPVAPASPTPAELAVLRVLAQLAVNIVDFIDEDDISTPFHFYTLAPDDTITDQGATSPRFWVFGTELPHVSLNEALVEFSAGASLNKVWVELHNPYPIAPVINSPPGSYQQDVLLAWLTSQGSGASEYAPYQVVVADGASTWPGTPPWLWGSPASTNPLGDVPTLAVKSSTAPIDFRAGANDKYVDGTPQVPGTLSSGPFPGPYIDPYKSAASGGVGEGFMLIGPGNTQNGVIKAISAGGTVPNKTVSIDTTVTTSNSLRYANTASTGNVYVLLRRLANPHLPPQPNPSLNTDATPYNPYVTVDYLEQIPFVDPTTTGNASWGKVQPYASYTTPLVPLTNQVGPQGVPPPPAGTTQHTFGLVNNAPSTAAPPANYDWLVHLDRPPVSPIELLMVSGYAPYQLTHQFIQGSLATQKHLHRAPWFDKTARLFRALEYLDTQNSVSGIASVQQDPGGVWNVTLGGRVPGQVNLNDFWDEPVLQALCAAVPAGSTPNPNSFTRLDVTTAFANLLASRNPGDTAGAVPAPPWNIAPGMPSRKDVPFWSLAAPVTSSGDLQYPAGSGVNNTILRSQPGGDETFGVRLFQVTDPTLTQGGHPYLQNQMLAKIFNNVTTRSNTFVLWLTVGFFEVVDDTTTPVSLGKELNKDTGQNIRHHMFAVVDRTGLTLDPQGPATSTATLGVPVPGVNTVVVDTLPVDPNNLPSNPLSANPPPTMTDITISAPAVIRPGSVVTIDTGSNQETVTVTAVDITNKTFAARFNSTHGPNSPVWALPFGNPGPKPQFLPKDNSAVVLYYAVID